MSGRRGVPGLLAVAVFGLLSCEAFAHSGRTDATGCHTGKQPRHCHETGSETPVDSVSAGKALVGVASIIDGDTLDIHGTRLRLHGIDAPESGQMCRDGNDRPWRCGQQAALALSDRIARTPLRCHGQGGDRYGRIIAICYLNGEDINAWMVMQGWAMAYIRYSHDYAHQQTIARAKGWGIWQGTVTAPWDWRKRQ